MSTNALSEHKIRPEHRDRLAIVYVRQSTVQQVQHHRESTQLQYGLVEQAHHLGWSRGQVMVIDEDLGSFGRRTRRLSTSVERSGTQPRGADPGCGAVAASAQLQGLVSTAGAVRSVPNADR